MKRATSFSPLGYSNYFLFFQLNVPEIDEKERTKEVEVKIKFAAFIDMREINRMIKEKESVVPTTQFQVRLTPFLSSNLVVGC